MAWPTESHWIVCVADSPEGSWTLHDTLEEALEEYRQQIIEREACAARAQYDQTFIHRDAPIALCAVYQSRDYQTHPALDAWSNGTNGEQLT